MQKPNSLRKALTDAVPVLVRNPDMMLSSPGQWQLAATLARSLSFEKRYTLNVVVTDFTDDIDLLFVPIRPGCASIRPDIMTTDEGRKKDLPSSLTLMTTSSTRCQHQPVADRAHDRQRGRRRNVR